jgi:hypothetical protein
MDFENRHGAAQRAKLTGSGDILSSSTLMRWAVEGKVFEAGYGLEDTAIAMDTTWADTTPIFSLQAPASSSLIVIPLKLKLMVHDDGNALTLFGVAFTKPAGLCDTTMTLSGTALTSKHCCYRTNPAQTAQQSTALSNVTASALLAADYIAYHYGNAIDAMLTTGLANMGGPQNVQTWNFLKDGLPHMMTSGAAMLVYVDNGTTDANCTAYMQWAEVTKDDLY